MNNIKAKFEKYFFQLGLLVVFMGMQIKQAVAVEETTTIPWVSSADISIISGETSSGNSIIANLAQNYMTRFVQFCAVFAIFMLVVAGYKFIISRGNPEAEKDAKMLITWAIIGFLIVFLAYSIVNVSLGLPFFSDAENVPILF